MTLPLPVSDDSAHSVPPREQILNNLASQKSLLTQLFTLIANPQPVPTGTSLSHPIQQLYSSLQVSTDDLTSIVSEVRKHQDAWRKLEALKNEVKGLDGSVRRTIRELEKNRIELEAMVKEGRQTRENIDNVSKDPLPVKPLLAHARSLARHSSAPVSSLLAPVDKAQYQPWPTETAMRAGILFREGGSMSGVGDVGVIGEEQPRQDVMMVDEEQYAQQEERQHAPAPAVFSLDLNSDSDEE